MKRILTILLALIMVITVCAFAVACGDTTGDDGTTTTQSTQSTTTTTTTVGGGTTTDPNVPGTTSTTTPDVTTEPEDDLETWTGKTKMPGMFDVDFGGKTFLINSRSDETSGRWNNGPEIWVEAITNDAINDAVYERNQVMQTLYNCTIQLDDTGYDGFNADVAAGGGKYIGKSMAYSILGSTANGNYYNVLNLDIDFTQPWWDQRFFSDLTCNDKLYGMNGDFGYYAMSATWIMFFNLDVYDNHFGSAEKNIYDIVRDQEWTIDVMLQMCQTVKHDNNGDQTLTFSEDANADTLGMITTAHNIRGLYNACNEFYVSKDANGKMVCALQSSGIASDVIDKIRTLTTDESYVEEGYTNVQTAIENGTTLFAGEVMDVLARMSETENLRVGVLPQPKYSADQANYVHYVNNQADFYFVPTSYADMETIADFYTLFAAHSSKIVRTAYLNAYKYTYASDADSAEMVDIILDTRTYDPGYHGSFALAFDGVIPSMCGKTGKNQFTSAANRYAAGITSAIEAYEEKIAAIDDPV